MRTKSKGILLFLAVSLLVPTAVLALAINWTEHVVTLDYSRNPYDVGLLDIDDDGDTDLVTGATFFAVGALAWWENDGSQSFTEHQISGTGNFWIVRPVDIDNDGDGDIVVSRGGVGGSEGQDYRLTLYENDGSESFTAIDLVTDFANFFVIIEPVDIDGDNDTDIFVGSRLPGLFWVENTGGAPASWPLHVIDNTSPSLAKLNQGIAVDFDGDNDVDVVSFHDTGTTTAPTLYLWDNDGSETFTLQTPALHTLPSGPQPSGTGLDVSDLDDDGDSDVLVHYYLQYSVSGSVSWLENDGTNTFTEHPLTSVGEGGQVFAVDLDADGDEDVVASLFRLPGWIKWWDNDGSENFTESTLSPTQLTTSGTKIAIGDIDGDVALDIAQTAFDLRDVGWWESDLDLPAIPIATRWGLAGTGVLLLAALSWLAIRKLP